MHSARSPFTPDVFGLPSDPLDLLDLALTAGLTAGGVGHVLLTPVFYRHESAQNRAWFAGAGLAMVFQGLLNIARLRGDASATGLSRAANPAGTLLLAAAAASGASRISIAGAGISAALTAIAMRSR